MRATVKQVTSWETGDVIVSKMQPDKMWIVQSIEYESGEKWITLLYVNLPSTYSGINLPVMRILESFAIAFLLRGVPG